jgi:AraC-like DNA-binding protein
LGVRFAPGGAHPFFAPSASELRDTQTPLDALWGAQAASLEDQLRTTHSAEAQFHLLEQALLAHAVRPLERHPAVAFALHAFMAIPQTRAIAYVADQVALSHAWFIQVFRDEVGLTPKQFCRVRRFLATLRRTRKGERTDWAQVAKACGYYDQAHLHRDFQHFAGVCPGVYMRERSACFPTYLTLSHKTPSATSNR